MRASPSARVGLGRWEACRSPRPASSVKALAFSVRQTREHCTFWASVSLVFGVVVSRWHPGEVSCFRRRSGSRRKGHLRRRHTDGHAQAPVEPSSPGLSADQAVGIAGMAIKDADYTVYSQNGSRRGMAEGRIDRVWNQTGEHSSAPWLLDGGQDGRILLAAPGSSARVVRI
ncbi:hypothetical protein OIDMADRAFT_53717 [Oidiodendron maius Zn]|uniref:Uncharacterized protein n=1 Tax=Oidiodendron maius (strain Zn) TaxID=913774 RepID=A0A0C3H230_OIDMZ|nr:hypothetical protein OIDMADRAFT_53717 [Oidiodendron maius Zn]